MLILILIKLLSTERSGEFALMRKLARAFAAQIHKVLMRLKTNTRIYTWTFKEADMQVR